MNRAFRSSLWLGLLACQLGAAACDPNVVIGARWRSAAGGTEPTPTAGTGSGATDAGGTDAAGTSGVAGGGSGGSAGSGAGGAGGSGGAGELAGADPGGAAGDGGEPSIPIYFSADHEDATGSLAQWDAGPDDDAGGYYGDVASGSPTYSTDYAHSGVGSAKATIDTSGGTDQISRLYRRVTSDEAYYSAWFYLPVDHDPTRWWSFFLFRAVQDRNKSIDLWSVDLVHAGAELTLTLFRHATNENVAIPSAPVIEIGQWFQLEAYLYAKQGEPSKLTLWLDGEEILALDDEAIPPADQPLYWVVGNGAAPLAPAVSSIYIDDAVIAAARSGP